MDKLLEVSFNNFSLMLLLMNILSGGCFELLEFLIQEVLLALEVLLNLSSTGLVSGDGGVPVVDNLFGVG